MWPWYIFYYNTFKNLFQETENLGFPLYNDLFWQSCNFSPAFLLNSYSIYLFFFFVKVKWFWNLQARQDLKQHFLFGWHKNILITYWWGMYKQGFPHCLRTMVEPVSLDNILWTSTNIPLDKTKLDHYKPAMLKVNRVWWNIEMTFVCEVLICFRSLSFLKSICDYGILAMILYFLHLLIYIHTTWKQ